VHLDLLTHPAVLIVSALAVTRLARLVTIDAFPFGVLRKRVAEWANDRYAPNAAPLTERFAGRGIIAHKVSVYDGQAPLSYLLHCPWCMSMWIAPVVAVLAATGTWWLWLAVPLAFSTVAGLLASLAE